VKKHDTNRAPSRHCRRVRTSQRHAAVAQVPPPSLRGVLETVPGASTRTRASLGCALEYQSYHQKTSVSIVKKRRKKKKKKKKLLRYIPSPMPFPQWLSNNQSPVPVGLAKQKKKNKTKWSRLGYNVALIGHGIRVVWARCSHTRLCTRRRRTRVAKISFSNRAAFFFWSWVFVLFFCSLIFSQHMHTVLVLSAIEFQSESSGRGVGIRARLLCP
jgi:hypothetical protein